MQENQNWRYEVDTYIEQQFKLKSQRSALGNKLWSDWIYNKNQYEERTKTTIFEFMNYSRHDASHSINILRAIERLLGKERVELLGIGDLWILLNAAYAHDIGMSTEYYELKDLWKNEEFLDFVERERDSLDEEIGKAARHYTYLDAFVKHQGGISSEKLEIPNFEWDEYDSWPLEFRKEITCLMSEYIRKKHGNRSKEFFNRWDRRGNIVYIDRLCGILGQIVALHTAGQEDIKKISLICDGFEDDYVHPQFLAVLLRVGDLLDLDNNRFDIFAMKHFGELPHVSVTHYKKHQAIEHLLIKPEKIEVTAKSDDFEVCKISLMWFDDLKSEIINMITRWQEIAPCSLQGCHMGIPELIILHKNKEFSSEFSRDFEVNRNKLLELFTGNNLYDSSLDFIREYVQNSFDALRIMLWNDLEQGGEREKYLIDPQVERDKIKPIDFRKEAYDNYPVKIYIREYRDKKGIIDEEQFVIEIEDRGIGIDETGINSISHIGTGWRERTNFTNTIREMRQWLRPTGGFGIGLQSAFMVTNKVEIYTKAKNNPAFKITLSQDEKPNNILVEYGQQKVDQGTRIHLVIKFSEIDADSILDKYSGKEEWRKLDLFSYENRLLIVWKIVINYMKEHFKNSLFPINIYLHTGQGKYTETIQSKYFFVESEKDTGREIIPRYKDYAQIFQFSEEEDEIENSIMPGTAEECEVLRVFASEVKKLGLAADNLYMNFNMDKGTLRLWDDMSETFYSFDLSADDEVSFMAAYKNVNVPMNSRKYLVEDWRKNPYLTCILLDVMGKKVEDCLLVSRNRFFDNAIQQQFLVKKYTQAYFKARLYFMEKYDKRIRTKLLFPMTLICNKVLEESIDNSNAFMSDGLYVWTITEGVWKREYYLYEYLFHGLRTGDIILAIPENEEEINYTIDENSDGFKELVEKIVIIDDIKIRLVLNYYLIQDDKMVLKRLKTTNVVEKDTGKPNFGAFRILNRNDSEIPGIKREINDMSKTFNSGEREYKLVVKAEEGQEALLVKKLPFIPEQQGVYYVIHPINAAIEAKINRMKKTMHECHSEYTKFTLQEYINVVQDDPSFDRLCLWVYKNQKESGSYDLEAIRKAYRRLLTVEFKRLTL